MVAAATVMPSEKERLREEKRRTYLHRVDALIADINTWLTNDLALIPITNGTHITDETGGYDATSYRIVQKDLLEPDNYVADLLPEGCSVLLGEGLVDICGCGGTESIMYLRKEELIITDAQGNSRPMFKDVDGDGWYWLESSRRNRALPLNREIFTNIVEIAGCVV